MITSFAEHPTIRDAWDRYAEVATRQAREVGAAPWLARVRIAQLYAAPDAEHTYMRGAENDGVPTDRLDAVRRWPDALELDERDRAALALVEQMVLDAEGMTDDQVRAAVDVLGEAQVVATAVVAALADAEVRLSLVLDQLHDLEGAR